MRIEKIKNSNVRKPGQLLVVPKYCKLYGNTAFFRLRENAEIGLLQFYRHRQEPVPWISRAKHRRLFRHPRTTNERRTHFSNEATKEILESYGVAFKLRQNENRICCPTPMMISPSSINEAGKSIAEPNEKAQAASTAESTALRFGSGEARRRLIARDRHRPRGVRRRKLIIETTQAGKWSLLLFSCEEPLLSF
jgi:hypothetical protein